MRTHKVSWSAITFWLIALFLWAIVSVAHGQSASPQSQDLEQLKEKLSQLEQMMQEVKDEMNALETKRALDGEVASLKAIAPPSTNVKTPSQVMPLLAVTNPTKKQEPQEPQDESKMTMEHDTIPAPEGTLEMYGFSMLDAGYNFGQIDPDWYDTMRPTKLDAFKDEFAPSGTWFASVRQTRFGVKTNTPTHFGDLKTIFEFELFGTGVDQGQTTFRLRHAWGEVGKFGAGQTWSPFMDPDVFPNSLEYWGPTGMVFFRNIQFRWMPITRGDSHLWIAAERPGASADGGVYADRIDLANVQPRFTMPDISVQAHLARSWGYLQVAGIFRRIAWEQTTPTPPVNLTDNVLGWGVNVSSNLKLTKQNLLRMQVVYGDGIENYMNDAPVDVGIETNPGSITMPVKGTPLPVLGTVTFLDHTWSEKFQSTIGYSFENIDNSNAQLPSAFHQGDYALTNLTFYPVKNVMVGGEFQYGRRVNFSDGFNVNDYKVQFTAKFNYSRLFGHSSTY